jgi:cell division protein FtsN
MRGVFDDGEPEPAEHHWHAELTLGSKTLATFSVVLVLICGLFFGLGYVAGRNESLEPTGPLLASDNRNNSLQADPTRPKPSATAPIHIEPAPPSFTGDAAVSAAARSNPVRSASTPETSANDASPASAGKPQAAPPQSAGESPSKPADAVAPAKEPPAPAVPTMVQIAAIAHPEDAEVLVNALQKRGYTVTVRREAGDSLIHVEIGPFANRADASAMRLKLLNDGYNAVLKP